MKQIINIRIEGEDIVLFQLANGIIMNKADIFADMVFNHGEYYILTNNGFKPLKFDENGTTVTNPPIEELHEINNL